MCAHEVMSPRKRPEHPGNVRAGLIRTNGAREQRNLITVIRTLSVRRKIKVGF